MTRAEQAQSEYDSSVEIYRRGSYQLRYAYDFADPEHVALWVALALYVDHAERLDLSRHASHRINETNGAGSDDDPWDYSWHLYTSEYPHSGRYTDPYRLEDDLWALYRIAEQQPQAAFVRRYELVQNITECLFTTISEQSPMRAELPSTFFKLDRLQKDAPAHTQAQLAPLMDMIQVVFGGLVSIPGTANRWGMSRQGASQRINSRGMLTVTVGGKIYLAKETVEREHELILSPPANANKLAAMYRSVTAAVRTIVGPRPEWETRTDTSLLKLDVNYSETFPLFVDAYWWASAVSLAANEGGWGVQQFKQHIFGDTEASTGREPFAMVIGLMNVGSAVDTTGALAFAEALERGIQHLEDHDPKDRSSFWLYLNHNNLDLSDMDKRHVLSKYRTLIEFAREGSFSVRGTTYMLHGHFYGPSRFPPEDYDPLTHEPRELDDG